jgi:hypothetical protein
MTAAGGVLTMGGTDREPDHASPLSTGLRSLTLWGIVIVRHVNAFDAKTAGRNRRIYLIWCSIVMIAPYIAVNGIEQLRSRRFGRDSFQTRSTP